MCGKSYQKQGVKRFQWYLKIFYKRSTFNITSVYRKMG